MLISLKGNKKVACIDKLDLDKRKSILFLGKSQKSPRCNPRLPSYKLSRSLRGERNQKFSDLQMSACGDVCVLGHRKRKFGKLALNMRLDDHRERMSAFVLEDPRGICWASLRSDSLHLILFFMEPLLSSLFHNLD